MDKNAHKQHKIHTMLKLLPNIWTTLEQTYFVKASVTAEHNFVLKIETIYTKT